MADEFENHCWKDIVPPDVLDIYSHYVRKVFVGPAPALLAIDLYELVYQGGARPVAELARLIQAPAANMPMPRSSRPSACSPRRARRGCRCSTRPGTARSKACPTRVTATKRQKRRIDPADLRHPGRSSSRSRATS